MRFLLERFSTTVRARCPGRAGAIQRVFETLLSSRWKSRCSVLSFLIRIERFHVRQALRREARDRAYLSFRAHGRVLGLEASEFIGRAFC